MEENLFDHTLFSEFFDNQPQALVWLQPIQNDKGCIIDFLYAYSNEEGLRYLHLKKEMLNHITIYNTPSLPTDMRDKVFNEMLRVFETGNTSETFVYNPVINKYGRVFRTKFRNGILNIIHDNTPENHAIQQLEKKTKELEYQRSFANSILDSSANGFFALEAVFDTNNTIIDFTIVKVNKAFCQIVGRKMEEVEGKSYLSLYPGSIQAGTFAMNCSVIQTGLPARKEMHYNADGLNAWYDISIVKWGDIGLVITFNDVTERKQSEIEREQTNLLIQTMLNASFHGKALLAPIKDHEENIIDFKVIATNSAAEKQININPSVAIGKPLSEILPGYIKTGGFEKYKKVFETGKHLRYEQFYKDDTFEGWFDIYLSPVTNGIVVSFANITKSKEEAIRIQQQKNLLNAIMTHSPSGISVTEVIRDEQRKVIDGRTLLANKAAIEYIGIPEEFYLTKTATELDPGIIESPLYQMAVKTLETGETFHTQYFIEQSKRWLELSVAKMDEEHLINVFTDITGSKEVQLQVEQFAEKLNTVIDTSQTGFFLGSPAYDERGEIIDFRFTLVNQVMASYVGKQPKELMGQLGSDWFITYKKNGLFERFKETWLTGARQQFDIHYQGETVEVWANIMTAKLGDELLGSFTDFTPIKKLQLQLEKSVEELVRSNANLEQFAYAASHDLQEPLRKINFFSEQLRKDLSQRLTEDNIRKFDRMQNATNRMKILINDLLDYSKVSVKPDVYEDVELSDVVEQVLQDLEATILATGAVINVGRLPQIKGDEQQLTHVFQNILSNALKYRKLDTITVVTISSKIVAETDLAFATINDVKKGSYHLIEIIDNGIGFEQQQSEKIFQVFQRLHGRAEYEGTGVGLAIVQKVISNHKGYITALSEPGKGARFLIMLPA